MSHSKWKLLAVVVTFVGLFLLGPILVARAINQPRDPGLGAGLGANLLGANARGPNEIRPPMIVRSGAFVFLPLHQGRAADQNNVFARGRSGRSPLRQEQNEGNENREQSLHQS